MNSKVQSVKVTEVNSEVIDKLAVGAWSPQSGDGKRYRLFVKIYTGDGLNKASGIEFDQKEDAEAAQKVLHSVLNEVFA